MVMAGKGYRIGYVRVSSTDRNADRQLEHVVGDRVFTDKASGKDVSRVNPPAKSLESARQVSEFANIR